MTERRPPNRATKAMGGMLAVVVTEGHKAPNAARPVTQALLDLAATLAFDPNLEGPGHRTDAGPGPAWLLPLVIVHDSLDQAIDVSERLTCGAPTAAGFLRAAAAVLASDSPAAPTEACATDDPALATALWVLGRGRRFADLLEVIVARRALASDAEAEAHLTRLREVPAVAAAAGALVGLRDGIDAIPHGLYRRLGSDVCRCLELATRLTVTRPRPRAAAGALR